MSATVLMQGWDMSAKALTQAWDMSMNGFPQAWNMTATGVSQFWDDTKKGAAQAWSDAKNNIGQYIPEVSWTEFTADQRHVVLQNLDNFGVEGQNAAAYVRQHNTQFGFLPQANSGAGWTLQGNMTLPPGANLNDDRNTAVLIHEALHLQQPLTTRLSVYGELEAWQLEYKAYYDKTGQYYGTQNAPFYDPQDPQKSADTWKALSQLDSNSRADLAKAQVLMKVASPVYRSDQLPLQPIEQEIAYNVTQTVEGTVNKTIGAVTNALEKLHTLVGWP